MRRLRIWHLLLSFHMSVWCTICMEHRVNNLATHLLTAKLLPADLLSADLLPADLLSEIHRLIGEPLVLESGIDLAC